ncbi:MAG: hypothetical protein KAR42_16760 [candidate division Zixibacteria bacterium]|nr:hypothetical protein [candidate division Zixibacteria bacterium]
MAKYDQVYREEPQIYETGDLHFLACCDCGLVHGMIFKIKNKKEIEVTTFDAMRSTGQVRRHGDCNLMKKGGSRGFKMVKVSKKGLK